MNGMTRRGFMGASAATAALVAAGDAFGVWGPPAPAKAAIVPTATPAEEIALIRKHLIEAWTLHDTIDDSTTGRLEWTYRSKATDYLASLRADGSWGDVDYASTTSNANGLPWSPYRALDRIQAMAAAVAFSGTAAATRGQLMAGVTRALTHWFSRSPAISSTNWWENGIGIQLRMMRIGILVKDRLSADLRTKIIALLKKDYDPNYLGTNGAWFVQQIIARGVLADDTALIVKGRDGFGRTYTPTPGAGVQVDGSLHEHNKDTWVPYPREQEYMGGYGRSLLVDSGLWLAALRGTSMQFTPIQVADHFTYLFQGYRWFIHGDLMLFDQAWQPTQKRQAQRLAIGMEQSLTIDATQQPLVQQMLNDIALKGGGTGASGSKAFWKSDFFTHHRPGWGLGVKMVSIRQFGGEVRMTNSLGYNAFQWVPFGAQFISRTGAEVEDLMPIWDWSKIPGVTHPDYKTNAQQSWPEDNNFFVGGVDNGAYGCAAYDFDFYFKPNTTQRTKAKKSWFAFDDEVVALGTAISSTDNGPASGTPPTITTVTQVNGKGSLVVGGTTIPAAAEGTPPLTRKAKWAYHDGIAYAFPGSGPDAFTGAETEITISHATRTASWKDLASLNPSDIDISKPVVALWLSHGVKPTNGQYAYVIRPGVTDAAAAKAYSDRLPVRLIKNTSALQGVRHDGLKIAQLAFYAPGSAAVHTGLTVTVSKPCLLIVDESRGGAVLTVADPTKTLTSIDITTVANGTTKKTTVTLPTGEYAGRSTPVGGDPRDLALRRPVMASSTKDSGLDARRVTDGNPNSRWGSDYANNQWVRVDLQEARRVASVRLSWEVAYGKRYTVETSKDGVTWDAAFTQNAGSGGTVTHSFPARDARFVRLTLIERGTGWGFSLWGVEVFG